MRRAADPFQVVERRNQFQICKGRAILSVHDNYLDAEDAALHAWLDPKSKGQDDEEFEATA